jgi:hypothetical protein
MSSFQTYMKHSFSDVLDSFWLEHVTPDGWGKATLFDNAAGRMLSVRIFVFS